jgi:hypothetical protein
MGLWSTQMNELDASQTEKLLQYVDLISSLMDAQSPESDWLPVDLWFPGDSVTGILVTSHLHLMLLLEEGSEGLNHHHQLAAHPQTTTVWT